MSQTGVRIKICGLITADEAVACVEAGADWIGLNFHPRSPRFLKPSRAAQIVAHLPHPECAVGLFVDRPPAEVAAIARTVGLSSIQLHGSEPPEDLLELADFRLIRAFRLSDPSSVAAMIDYLDRAESLGCPPDAVLVDAFVPGQPGGTGAAIAAHLLEMLPPLPRLIMAGGLTPENVAERVARFRPWMVDVASGVESSPGRKDPAKIAAFVAAVRKVSTA